MLQIKRWTPPARKATLSFETMSSPSDYRFLPLRRVLVDPASERACDRWLAQLDEELSDRATDRNEFCRKVLESIHFPGGAPAPAAGRDEAASLATRVTIDQLDPRNVTLEAEYYRDIDPERYYRVKPLLWLWEMFDKSVLGENVHLGVKFRRMLARRIFNRCGRNFKAFHFVKFSFGYGMEVGDDVVVHRHVLLDDRGGIRIGAGASVSDYTNVYSHSHHVSEAREVRTPATVIGDRVRIAYHATILAGVNLAPDSMVGAGALVSKDTEPGAVYAGVPARVVRRKPQPLQRPETRDPLGEA